MMVCKIIGCPHPRFLQRYGMQWSDLVDWKAFLIWENRTDDEDDNSTDKIALLQMAREKLGA